MNSTNNHYRSNTAGYLMTDKIPVVRESAAISDIESMLLKETANFETINYIYAVDEQGVLKGVISLKELFRSPKTKKVSEFIKSEVISARTHTDQERVALLALKHNLKSIPVVDKEGRLVGIVSQGDIMRILDSEAVENILRFGGILHFGTFDNVLKISVIRSLIHRLPWLVLGLLGGMLTAGVVGKYEDLLSRNIIIAAFIPLIVYIADAVGTQMEAFIIRDFAMDPKMSFIKYFLRHFFIVSLIGAIMSILLYGISLFYHSNENISLVLGLSLFFAILSSIFTGLLIPFLFGKANLDPANASGPIATIIQDVLSVLVYFIVASQLL